MQLSNEKLNHLKTKQPVLSIINLIVFKWIDSYNEDEDNYEGKYLNDSERLFKNFFFFIHLDEIIENDGFDNDDEGDLPMKLRNVKVNL